MYEYKVVSGLICPNYKKQETFESCLETLLNKLAPEGWEFYAQNDIREKTSPGCFGMFCGRKEEIIIHQVFVFRRNKN